MDKVYCDATLFEVLAYGGGMTSWAYASPHNFDDILGNPDYFDNVANMVKNGDPVYIVTPDGHTMHGYLRFSEDERKDLQFYYFNANDANSIFVDTIEETMDVTSGDSKRNVLSEDDLPI